MAAELWWIFYLITDLLHSQMIIPLNSRFNSIKETSPLKKRNKRNERKGKRNILDYSKDATSKKGPAASLSSKRRIRRAIGAKDASLPLGSLVDAGKVWSIGYWKYRSAFVEKSWKRSAFAGKSRKRIAFVVKSWNRSAFVGNWLFLD